MYFVRDISSMLYVAFGNEKKEFLSYRNGTKWSYIEFAKQIYRMSVSEYIANKQNTSIVLLSMNTYPDFQYALFIS